jgi:YbbR domain-containing protein
MKKYINRKLGKRLYAIILLLAIFTSIYAYYGINHNKDIFTNEMIYDEMAGIIPILVLVASFILFLAAIIIRLFTKH